MKFINIRDICVLFFIILFSYAILKYEDSVIIVYLIGVMLGVQITSIVYNYQLNKVIDEAIQEKKKIDKS